MTLSPPPLRVKDVFRQVCLNNSDAIIVVRIADNSKDRGHDFTLLPYLRAWAAALDTDFIDYVVVCPDDFLSFRKEGYGQLLGERRKRKPEQASSEYQPSKSEPVKSEPSPEQLRRTAIGAQIKKLRMEQGMKQKDFAAKSGVRQPMVSSIELGHKEMSSATAEKIAAALGVQPQELLNLSEDATTNAEAQKEVS